MGSPHLGAIIRGVSGETDLGSEEAQRAEGLLCFWQWTLWWGLIHSWLGGQDGPLGKASWGPDFVGVLGLASGFWSPPYQLEFFFISLTKSVSPSVKRSLMRPICWVGLL